MTNLLSLPTEIVLEIRSFLYPTERNVSEDLQHYADFILKENCWSWRNFLSVRNSKEWRSVRKDAMIWSLNKYAIKKYMDDELFRANINDMDSKQKIQLILQNCNTYSLTQLQTALDTRHIGLIDISNYALPEFPSSKSVQTLILNNEKNELRILGNYENLETLELTGASTLTSIGNMEKLLHLSLGQVGISCLFPLEQLISFHLDFDGGNFEQFQDRFLLLEHLYLFYGICFSLSTHNSSLKKLKSLSLAHYDVVNLSGLDQLISLNVRSVVTLLGKEEIFPKLRILQSNEYFLNYSQLNKLSISKLPANLTVDYINQCLQFPNVQLGNSLHLPEDHLVIDKKVKMMRIQSGNFRSFRGVLPGRYFDEIVLEEIDQ
jgi:hypothetical protein